MKSKLIRQYLLAIVIPSLVALPFVILLENFHAVSVHMKALLLNVLCLMAINLPIFSVLVSKTKWVRQLLVACAMLIIPGACFSYWLLTAKSGGGNDIIIWVLFAISNMSVNLVFFADHLSGIKKDPEKNP